ncbi:MAG: TonB-dependent receptor [Ignavibacteriae bacterium]|nr:TonB-dependent receptor [Ignavibacteriota bacterium]
MIRLSFHRVIVLEILFLLFSGLTSSTFAGTTGKLSGRVLDKNKNALPSANIIIVGTNLGAASDIEGYYSIINMPPGKYKVQFSIVGYRTYIVQDILITTNNTTKLDAELEESVVTTDAVVVTAQRPVVDVNLTSSIQSLTSKEIETLPVQDVQDVVNLQAGVVDGHFRGGRIGEVQYQVNGVTVNNAYDNSSSLRLDRSLIQEVQVISGTFDAEYGQAMSGVVNAVLKSGSEQYSWNAEMYAGTYLFTGLDKRVIPYTFRPAELQNYQFSLSGPFLFDKTFFVVNARRYINYDYFYGERRFLPTDSSNFEKKIFLPTGDGTEVPLGFGKEVSGLAKITNRSLEGIELSYQAIVNKVESKRANFGFRFLPDATTQQQTFSIVHGLDLTHTLSNSTFYNLSLRQNYFDYTDYAFEDMYDPRYYDAGPLMTDAGYEYGAVVQGYDLGRFLQRTDSYVLKGALTSQITREHQMKVGIEAQFSHVKFGVPGYIVQTNVDGVEILKPRSNEPPDYPNPKTYHPVTLSGYVQDQVEWNDLNLRAGVRAEYFDAMDSLPGDLQNPANSIAGAPVMPQKATKAKTSVSPRLGISYPITTTAALFFAYGHFYQYPGLGQVFTNSDYSVLERLQAGGISYGVMGNPDIKPERTIQYEFGYKHEISEFLGMDMSIFYKDIRDLLGVEFITTYSVAEYARLTNVDFGNVLGFTITFDQRQIGLLSISLDYTYQKAQGNSSDSRETATRASAGEDPRPRQIPLAWDQRHTLNLTVILQETDNFSASAVLRYGSGQPYTPSIGSGFGAGLETNSGRKDNAVVIDVRGEKYFSLAGIRMSLFARVFNLLDTRFNNGFVFTDTGSPDYTLNPVGNIGTLINPQRYFPPRRIEIGISLNSL